MFITFEGLDFSGKSTQATLLVKRLKSLQRMPVLFLREPGGTRISERLRDILLDKKNLEMSPAAELFLFSASRAQIVSEVIRPALARGEIVICDRFYDSTTAYQGHGRGLDIDTIDQVNTLATGGIIPDITFFIDIPISEIHRRHLAAGKDIDRMESSGAEFYQKVRDGYLAIARLAGQRIIVVDGTQPIETVQTSIWHSVEERIPVVSQ